MSASDKIAVSAAVIAACAFFATLWQARLARVHNRLSVRPLLVWVRERSVTEAGTEVTFIVRNYGVGPAVIKQRHLMLNDAVFKSSSEAGDDVAAFTQEVFGSKFPYHLRQHGLPGVGSAIPQGGEHVIARLFFPGCSGEMVDAVFQQSGNVAFRIIYESLYKEKSVLLAK